VRISHEQSVVRRTLTLALPLMLVWGATPARGAPEAPDPSGLDGAPTAQRGATEPRFAVGIFGSGVTGQADGLDSGQGLGASFAAFLSRNVGLELGYRRHAFDILETDENGLSGGDMDTDMVTAGVVFRVPNDSLATPWVAGGIAWFRNDAEIDPAVRDPLEAFGFIPQEEVDDVLGFQVGGGVDVRVATSIAVFGEARFASGSADTSATLTDSVSGVATTRVGDQDVRAVSLSGGVRFVF